MQTDSEARHRRDAASVSISQPIRTARCATEPTVMEWVPDRERRVVPDPMTALCRQCPGRRPCLLWALTGREQGYWAGTTSADRELMRQLGQDSIHVADWLQTAARQGVSSDEARHAAGEGSYWWYRRGGCRCRECKAANAEARAGERAKARWRAA